MSSHNTYPSHPDAQLVEDPRAGDLICPACGLVVGERIIDVSTEWRSFSDERSGNNDPSRVGALENPIFSTSSTNLSTNIAAAYGSQSDQFGIANMAAKEAFHPSLAKICAAKPGKISTMDSRISQLDVVASPISADNSLQIDNHQISTTGLKNYQNYLF